MAVTLDATLSGATSNSYIDMAIGGGVAENIPGGGDWAALGEEERNLSLIVATRWLETLDLRRHAMCSNAASEVAKIWCKL